MRHLTIGVLSSTCLLVAACDSAEATGPRKPPPGAMTNDPQKIVSEPGSIRTLHGEFEIREAKPNERYIVPATFGGACLLAHIPVEGKSCTEQSQCNIILPGQPGQQPETWGGYCLGSDHLPSTQGGSCWVKISDEKNCLRFVEKGKYSTPSMDMSPAYTYVSEHSPNWHKPIDWVLLGCLNGDPPGGCGDDVGPHIATASKVRPVP